MQATVTFELTSCSDCLCRLTGPDGCDMRCNHPINEYAIGSRDVYNHFMEDTRPSWCPLLV